MKLLDLYCGVGLASDGYAKAGFEITGVDWVKQPRYPYEFVQADALEYLGNVKEGEYDLIHASPPCQGYADGMYKENWIYKSRYAEGGKHGKVIEKLRDMLNEWGGSWVIENIDTAPLNSERSIVLCGTWFRLEGEKFGVIRHRLFETNWGLELKEGVYEYGGRLCLCDESVRIGSDGWVTVVAGTGDEYKGVKVPQGMMEERLDGSVRSLGVGAYVARLALGLGGFEINRGTYAELREGVPPAYTEFIGACFKESIHRPLNLPVDT